MKINSKSIFVKSFREFVCRFTQQFHCYSCDNASHVKIIQQTVRVCYYVECVHFWLSNDQRKLATKALLCERVHIVKSCGTTIPMESFTYATKETFILQQQQQKKIKNLNLSMSNYVLLSFAFATCSLRMNQLYYCYYSDVLPLCLTEMSWWRRKHAWHWDHRSTLNNLFRFNLCILL